MRRLLALVLSLSLAPALFAASADLAVTAFNVSVTPTETGERFAVFMRWRNNGPDEATIVNATISGTPAPFFVVGVGTSGWPCYTTAGAPSFTCQGSRLAPGGEAELVLNVIAPASTADGSFVLRADVRAAEADPQPANNSAIYTAQLTNATASSDLSITPTSQALTAAAGQTLTIPFIVTNPGPSRAERPVLVLTLPVSQSVPTFSAQGEGWSCGHGAYGPQLVICTRDEFAAGAISPVLVSLTAPESDGTFELVAHVRAERLYEPVIANNTARATITVGETAQPPLQWSRVLVPITADDVPGSNNALWRTETTVMLASDATVAVRPYSCGELTPLTCLDPALPLNRPFNARLIPAYGFGGWPNGQFFYVLAGDESKIRINSRVYDVARLQETAGSEIPIAREHDFVARPISLLGIPVAPQFRHTLRVYGFDGQSERVQINVYANDETIPRVSETHTLVAPAFAMQLDDGRVPTHPSYAQFQLDQLLALGGIQTVRIDVTPLEGGRIWSFVSVTNNQTHHVTTFSAQ